MALSHRVERIAEQIREEVSQILATEVADPGVGLVTVTRVKVTPDLSLARIYWTTMGDAAARKQTTKALSRAAGFVRHLLAIRLTLRRSPEVQFLFDRSVAAQDRVEEILYELKQQEAAREASVAADTAPPGDTAAASDAAETPDTPSGADADVTGAPAGADPLPPKAPGSGD